MTTPARPVVLADLPLSPAIAAMLKDSVELVPWDSGNGEAVSAIYTYGHPTVDGALLDRLPRRAGHQQLRRRRRSHRRGRGRRRGIPVGNTPGILDGATADMALALLLAAGRRLVEGRPLCPRAEFPPLRSFLHARAARFMGARSASSAWAGSARRSPGGLAAST